MIKSLFAKKTKPVEKALEKVDGFFCMEFEGLKIYTHDIECINRAFRHIFERHIYNFNFDGENPVIIDAGANIGLGVLYWKIKFPNAKIIAFEPSRMAFASLQKNVVENKLTNVICINKALFDKVTKIEFNTNEIISGSIIMEKNLETKYEVETTPIAEYLKEKIDFLKIDIEGAEKFIFNDVATYIHNLNYIFLEYHSFINQSQYLAGYLNLFEKNNFRYFIEDEYKKTNHFVEESVSLNQDMQLNIWANRVAL